MEHHITPADQRLGERKDVTQIMSRMVRDMRAKGSPYQGRLAENLQAVSDDLENEARFIADRAARDPELMQSVENLASLAVYLRVNYCD